MNDLKAVDSTNKDNERVDQNISVVVEKWMNRHNLKTLQRNDSQLETGVGGHEIIEDELVKRCTRMVLVSQKEKRNNRCIFFFMRRDFHLELQSDMDRISIHRRST